MIQLLILLTLTISSSFSHLDAAQEGPQPLPTHVFILRWDGFLRMVSFTKEGVTRIISSDKEGHFVDVRPPFLSASVLVTIAPFLARCEIMESSAGTSIRLQDQSGALITFENAPLIMNSNGGNFGGCISLIQFEKFYWPTTRAEMLKIDETEIDRLKKVGVIIYDKKYERDQFQGRSGLIIP